jgi:hypothetical protein
MFNIHKFYIVITLHLCVLHGSRNKQQTLSYTTLKDRFLQPWWKVFTARYGLIPYITQIFFVFKGITSHWIELNDQIHVPTDLARKNCFLFPLYVRICGPQSWVWTL